MLENNQIAEGESSATSSADPTTQAMSNGGASSAADASPSRADASQEAAPSYLAMVSAVAMCRNAQSAASFVEGEFRRVALAEREFSECVTRLMSLKAKRGGIVSEAFLQDVAADTGLIDGEIAAAQDDVERQTSKRNAAQDALPTLHQHRKAAATRLDQAKRARADAIAEHLRKTVEDAEEDYCNAARAVGEAIGVLEAVLHVARQAGATDIDWVHTARHGDQTVTAHHHLPRTVEELSRAHIPDPTTHALHAVGLIPFDHSSTGLHAKHDVIKRLTDELQQAGAL